MTKHGVTLGPSTRAEPLPVRGEASVAARGEAALARGVSVGGVIAGKYRIERVIGHGGMGVVVAASHLALQRTVAIKLIRGDWADDPLAVERLVREARALASIQSQHVARVLDVGTLDDGIPFIVMEYLEGQDLDSLLRSDGPLPVADAIDYLVQACEALAEAHRNGIVHRDIKPANLFVARQPGGVACIKVVDFGISKLINSASVESLTHPSRIVGSLYHMAPEQMSGDAVDARTDVWALGVLLFELLSGQKPFQAGAWPAVCARVLNDSAPPSESLGDHVPAEVQSAVRRCLQRMPQDRFSNVAELAVALSPFGTRIARVSLEHIVRLATSTGSLAAEPYSPLPPAPTPRGGFVGREREPSGSSLSAASRLRSDLAERRDSSVPPRRNTPLPPRGNTPLPARVETARREAESDDFERGDERSDEASGEALRLERRRPELRPPPPAGAVRRRNVQWLVVAAAALVVVSVPWAVTRLLRPAPEVRAVAAALPQSVPSIVEATPALLPSAGPSRPAAGGAAPSEAPGGPILEPAEALVVPSPPSTTPPTAPLGASQPVAAQPVAPQPVVVPPAAPQVRVLSAAEELEPAAPAATPAGPAEAQPEAPVGAAMPEVAAGEGTPAVAAESEPAVPAPGAGVGQAPPQKAAPRGANPWDFRDLEFE